jgi:hypothetical protein
VLAVQFSPLWLLLNGHLWYPPTLTLPPKRSRGIRTTPAPGPLPSPSATHEAFTPSITPHTRNLRSTTAASNPAVSQSLDTRLQIVWNVFHEPRNEGRVNVHLARTIITSCISGGSAAASERSALLNGCFAGKLFSLLFDIGHVPASRDNRTHADMRMSHSDALLPWLWKYGGLYDCDPREQSDPARIAKV